MQQRVAASNAEIVPVELFDPSRYAFLFDVDGTLLDIAPTPQSVHVPAELRQDLRRLNALAGGAIALVSGRTLDELDRLFGPLDVTLVGGHGAEIRSRRGQPQLYREPPIDAGTRRRLADIQEIDSRLLIEDKGYSVAIHYRLAPEQEDAVREAVAALDPALVAQRLQVLEGKAVIEVRRPGADKGAALRALMAQAPFSGRRPIYIGDDVTDADAFAVLPELGGVPIAVGRTFPGVVRGFEAPAEVRRWIAAVCRRYDEPAASVT
jgi:trehalose 6-phosphate phosphatase